MDNGEAFVEKKRKYKFGLRKRLVIFITLLAVITYSTSAVFLNYAYPYVAGLCKPANIYDRHSFARDYLVGYFDLFRSGGDYKAIAKARASSSLKLVKAILVQM